MSTPTPGQLAPLVLAALAGLGLADPAAAQILPERVLAADRIGAFGGGFEGTLVDGDAFGSAAASLGDLDGDGHLDVAIGSTGAGTDGTGRGSVWILFLAEDGTVEAHQEIDQNNGGFTGDLDKDDLFTAALAPLGDLDGDGVVDLAVGAPGDDDGTKDRGAVWIIFLNTDGTVKTQSKISALEGNFTGTLNKEDLFGHALAPLGDLDGDGNVELAVGALQDDDGGPDRGAVWVLYLNDDGTVKTHSKISATEGGFTGPLDDGDGFGSALACLGDLDGDTLADLVVGARHDDDGAAGATTDRGALWVLNLDANAGVASWTKLSQTSGNLGLDLPIVTRLGTSVATLGDLGDDGSLEIVAGSSPFTNQAWIISLAPDGTALAARLIDAALGFEEPLNPADDLGGATCALVTSPGVDRGRILMGAPGTSFGATEDGSVWLLFLNDRQWVDLGSSLEGTNGAPLLTPQGPLVTGKPVALSLTGGLGSALGCLALGLTQVALPFKGGLLVPAPEVVLAPLPLGPDGDFVSGFQWPPDVPPGTTLYAQFWIRDPGAPAGFAGSNAVVATVP